MSAPYWGELPQPKGIHDRRMSADYSCESANPEQRHSLDTQPPRKANRASLQTTYTETPTDTTFSPSSPTASNALPYGLAPRPPSSRHGLAQDQAYAGHDRKARRSSSNRNPDDRDNPSPALPVVPDVPRAPPMSYRDPYPNGAYPYAHPTPTTARPPRQAEGQGQAEEMKPDGYFPPQQHDSQPGSSQRPIEDATARRDSAAAAQPRRASASGTYEQRKKFAADRSPLQKLELTLDSMTKEEKRARVEAAEQRARQKAALRAASASQSSSDQAPVGEKQSTTIAQERQPTAALEPAAPIAPKAALPREVATLGETPAPMALPPQHVQEEEEEAEVEAEEQQRLYRQDAPRPSRPPKSAIDQQRAPPHHTQEEHHRYYEQDAPQPRRATVDQQKAPPTQNAQAEQYRQYGQGAPQPLKASAGQQPAAPEPAIPRRNLSFRERATGNDVRFHRADTSPPPNQPMEPAGTSFSLTRSGSNKLRKEPPSDSWHHVRTEAGRKQPVALNSTPFNDEIRAPRGFAQAPPKGTPQDKGLPPLSRSTTNQVAHPPAAVGNMFPVLAMRGDMPEVRRRATEPVYGREYAPDDNYVAPAPREERSPEQRYVHDPLGSSPHHHRISGMVFRNKDDLRPGDGLYEPPQWLDEWKKGTVGNLSGALLDLSSDQPVATDRNNAWWEREQGSQRRSSVTSRPRKAEAFDGEYDDTNGAPTRFKPPLYLKCGPLLRYCGMRHEKLPTRPRAIGGISEREIWRGSIMIVTNDAESSYEIAPMLRLFVQDIELLPPPPHRVDGDLSPEYVDPIAGHPKLGRRGGTLYVRPVEHLEEGRDLSRDESEAGLFEKIRSPTEDLLPNGLTDLPGSYTSRRRREDIDGEKMQKYKDVRGFRLHAEQGCTFWRFNIEVELREKQQRIAYRINRGPAMAFWVPACGQAMNMMFYSCNGFSASVKPDELSGPDPMWRDVLNSHQSLPFHAMIGGGDQIYNDCVADQCELFNEWLDIRNPLHKHGAAFTAEMQIHLEQFYLERYCSWFSQGLFGLANSQIPMVNMYDDHDIFDGYGSYAHHDMNSPVFSGLGAVAFKYYMLFQHQSVVTETENSEPSWVLGEKPGPYIHELSRSLYMSMGGKIALLAVDGRTERTEHTVLDEKTWEKIMNRLYAEVKRGQVEHLLVLLGVPIAYPRLVWLENILTSRLMDPFKALGKTGLLGKALNNIDGGVEVLDDLNDHWTAKNHKRERAIVIEDLQDLAIDKSLRVTILSGDVHLAAIGQFYSNPKLSLPKHRDPRYMPNIISSAIVNSPPPDLMADVLNKRNKVHHFDKQTDENMIPIFQHGIDGKPRNNKHLLPHRNWCSIRAWTPGTTPPPTPPTSDSGRSPSPESSRGGGIFRRFSSKRRLPSSKPFDAPRDSARGTRPPISSSGGLFRSFSRRKSVDTQQRPGFLTRTMSLGRGEAQRQRSEMMQFGGPGSQSQHDDGGLHGSWGPDYDDYEYMDARATGRARPSGLRGGGTFDEFSEGDESFFAAQPPRRTQTTNHQTLGTGNDMKNPPIRPFHRTPTGLSTKKMKQAEKHAVDLEGGLDICLNIEVNPKDPTGITVPYRLLVPKLHYEYTPEDDLPQAAGPSGIKKRFLSFNKRSQKAPAVAEAEEEEAYQSDDDDY